MRAATGARDEKLVPMAVGTTFARCAERASPIATSAF
jgi:hypothetical protein